MLLLFFFNDTATTEIYTLSLHDALPISLHLQPELSDKFIASLLARNLDLEEDLCDQLLDRKSTRLNSSHSQISYAVFCLKKITAPPRPFWWCPSIDAGPPQHPVRNSQPI